MIVDGLILRNSLTMPVPDYQAFMLPVLKVAALGPTRVADCMHAAADQLGISPEDRQELVPSGQTTKLYDRVSWAKTYLAQAGLIQRVSRGVFETSDAGKAELAKNPERIDKTYLLRFPAFVEFLNRRRVPSDALSQIAPALSSTEVVGADEEEGTPEERITEAHNEIVDDLRQQLLDLIRAASPAFFERLILDLLLAMGYGNSRPEMAQRIGRSGDGGIDGLINEDPLGLDSIFLQAKRYSEANTVGEEAIRGFCGALLARGATKGVFVTTSTFTRSARTFADSINQQKLILIDGERLTALMVQYGVGTRTESRVEIKRLDSDYFEELE